MFKGKLYRFEWVRENDPKKPIRDPNNKLGYDHFRFIDVKTGEATEPFAKDYRFGSAFVDGDTVYNGVLNWVYMEELFTRGDVKAYWW